MKENLKITRFKDAPWFPKEPTDVLVGGAGGIGSWLVLLLARANFEVTVYDFDTVEEHNIGGQLFRMSNIGQHKVTAVHKNTHEFADKIIQSVNEKVTAETPTNFFVFTAFDNIQARKDMFNSWSELAKEWLKDNSIGPEPIFIDGRLTMEQLQIFCVTPSTMDKYPEHLFDDAEIEEAPCTLKQTSHSAAMIASHMVGLFTNHFTNVQEKDTVREVPFFWEFFIPLNLVNEE